MSDAMFIETKGLTQEQLASATGLIQGKTAGIYTLRELFGEERWALVIRKRAYGQWFRRSVERGAIPRVRLAGRRSNRSLTYEVLPDPTTAASPHLTA